LSPLNLIARASDLHLANQSQWAVKNYSIGLARALCFSKLPQPLASTAKGVSRGTPVDLTVQAKVPMQFFLVGKPSEL